MSLLRRIAGVDRVETPAPSELRGVLASHAELFLSGGGSLSLAEWYELDQEERVAFVAAGRRLEVASALRAATASQGDLAALRVKAELDGGAEHDDQLLRAAVRGVAQRLRSGRGA